MSTFTAEQETLISLRKVTKIKAQMLTLCVWKNNCIIPLFHALIYIMWA